MSTFSLSTELTADEDQTGIRLSNLVESAGVSEWVARGLSRIGVFIRNHSHMTLARLFSPWLMTEEPSAFALPSSEAESVFKVHPPASVNERVVSTAVGPDATGNETVGLVAALRE